jgi:hypothetical protein
MTQAKGRRYEQSLDELFPSVAKEWHPTKNGALTPLEVTPGSNKKVWRLCKNGHAWQAGMRDSPVFFARLLTENCNVFA